MTESTVEFLESSDLISVPEALRARAREQGYLFFRGLLPEHSVLAVRERILQIVADHGWLAPGTEISDGIADPAAFSAVPASERTRCGRIPESAYRAIQHLPEFHRLPHYPQLIRMYEALFGRAVLPHPRNIARVIVPTGETVPTPPHQDFIHIQGSTDTWTAWIPLGDCPEELGGLSVLAGSHEEGLLSYREVDGAGGLEAYLCDLDYPWATGAFAAGDVLTFDSRTVHRARPHRGGDRIRLSCDFRYQPADEVVDPSSLQVHCGVDTWESIYAGWDDRSLAYYWQDRTLRLSEWDERIRWQQDRIC
ncbi:MAG TPA: phytanoyl-CoA dioxygenase family protein [Mycobacteriales bacterium]|nr:phytanoyl-CoA dioxygenase family protein [Mycobacteriales bacterium]